jgi:hypothetical protein
MPAPIELEPSTPPAAHLAGAVPMSDLVFADAADDTLYREIADRRAQLEDAEILRRARAL